MKFILASKNAHKAKEMQEILGENIEIVTQDFAGFGDIDVVEDGMTFEENAIKKAATIMKASNMPTIADDSGLCVDFLDGRPGIFSARYAGEHGRDDDNITKVLNELEGVPEDRRTARFVCVVALAEPGVETKVFRGEVEGRILTEKHGENGFGYDPIFFYPEFKASLAEISAEKKNMISHRFNALRKLKEYLG